MTEHTEPLAVDSPSESNIDRLDSTQVDILRARALGDYCPERRLDRNARRAIVAAAMARILPSAGGPADGQAHPEGYWDWLQTAPAFQVQQSRCYRGLAFLDALSHAIYSVPFTRAREAEQDELLRIISGIPTADARQFFEILLRMTIAGTFCSPEYGGNLNQQGWRRVRFEVRRCEVRDAR